MRAFGRYLDGHGHDGPIGVGVEPGLGNIDSLDRSVQPGPTVDSGARVPATPGRSRRRHRGPRAWAARPARAPHAAACVFRSRDRRSAARRCRPGSGRRAAAALLRHPVRTARLHGHADLRSAHAVLRRCRPGGRDLTVRAGKRGRTRLVPLHPSALPPLCDYAARPATTLRPARRGRGVLPHRPQRPRQLQRREPHLHGAASTAGLDRSRTYPDTSRARPAAPHGGATYPDLACRGHRCRRQDPGTGDLSRPCGSA